MGKTAVLALLAMPVGGAAAVFVYVADVPGLSSLSHVVLAGALLLAVAFGIVGTAGRGVAHGLAVFAGAVACVSAAAVVVAMLETARW